MALKIYNAEDFGKKEAEMMRVFEIQKEDAKTYFINCIKPRLDRWYKLYIAYPGDRAKEIKEWQANVFVPYINAVVETLMPRVLDSRPDLNVQGRNEDDQLKASKVKTLLDYNWEISRADSVAEESTRACFIYGLSFLQVSWKQDKRKLKFLKTRDVGKKKLNWEEKEVTYYDAPYVEWVDNYSLWYDWHNTRRESKQYWLKRLILTEDEIRRKYPMADKKRLELAFESNNSDLTDYAAVRNLVRSTHDKITKGSNRNSNSGIFGEQYNSSLQGQMKMYEVFEWWRPFVDSYAVIVGGVPILPSGQIPIPWDFKEAPFIDIPYLRLPGEFEGIGIPGLLESPQIMLNMIKNQRLDSATLGIHKMWIVNPLANIKKEELVIRPFGIIYSPDPNGVREVQFSDVKQSAYQEEEMLKGDMRYASGVDDFSMGAGGGADSATEVRHLRESTLERVRLFINHLGDSYSVLMRWWVSMYRQFMDEKMTIRILGDDGKIDFPIIEKDDVVGEFDFKATVLPSIAGMADIAKKQDMDLFQLLVSLPFIDQKKLTGKLLYDWNWSIDAISKAEDQGQGQQIPGMEGAEGQQMTPEMMGMQQGMMPPPQEGVDPGVIDPGVAAEALRLMGSNIPVQGMAAGANPFSELGSPINLLQNGGGVPPTPAGVPTSNPRGLNRGGKVNTNIPVSQNSTPEGQLANRALNIQ